MKHEEIFLTALKHATHGTTMSLDLILSPSDWETQLMLAQEHKILPLIYDTVYRCRSFKTLNNELNRSFQERAVEQVVRQIIQEKEFLTLLLHLKEKGFDPIVMKGMPVRNLYPQPYLRPSVDEDILIPKEQVETYHKELVGKGLLLIESEGSILNADELGYYRTDSPTFIEVHTCPFPLDSEAYGDCNRFFENVWERTIQLRVEDVEVRTLHPTDHLLFLILHAYKHFLHSGVGIRQVCDIGIFTETYREEIDWKYVKKCCQEQHTERFFIALFQIAEKYLGFRIPVVWKDVTVDEVPLLMDILSGGIYGVNDINRAHSSTITLEAVSAYKKGRTDKGLLASLFPKSSSLQNSYPYLGRFPWLLPVAWGQRITRYVMTESRNKDTSDKITSNNSTQNSSKSAAESLRIGKERRELLRFYGIIN